MRVLLTGATGFVGSYALRRLLDAGHEVAVLVRPAANPWRIADVISRATRVEGDLRDLAAAEPAIARFAPESVAHLAWGGVGNASRNDPAQVENLGPSLELVRLAARVGAGAFVGLGSQAEYGPHEGAIDERAATRPTTLYGATKLACGQLTAPARRAARDAVGLAPALLFVWADR